MGLFRKDFNDKMHETQRNMLALAQEIAQNNNASLDYSDGSIEELDKFLPLITKEFKEVGVKSADDFLDSEEAQGIAETLGCYIVECIERNHTRGTWVEDPDGRPWPGFTAGGDEIIYPLDWVMKKLINPDEYFLKNVYNDNVLL